MLQGETRTCGEGVGSGGRPGGRVVLFQTPGNVKKKNRQKKNKKQNGSELGVSSFFLLITGFVFIAQC